MLDRFGDGAEELRRLRAQVRDLAARLDARGEGGPKRTATQAVKVYTGGTIPTAADKFFATNPVFVWGVTTEGATATLTPDTSRTLFVDVLGAAPAVNDYLVAKSVDWRWVAEKKGTTTTVNPCRCTWPRALSYRGYVNQAASSYYFVNVPVSGYPEPVYPLIWRDRPDDIPQQLRLVYYNYPQYVTDPYYVTMPDQAWFAGPIPCSTFGNPTNVYFYMWVKQCQSNVMVIDAPYGIEAGAAGSRGAGNNIKIYYMETCTPFSFTDDGTHGKLTGTHGSDDIVPDRFGIAGGFTAPGGGS